MAKSAPTIIVITGASSGLGAALARSYAGPGVTLGLIGRNADRLAQTAASCEAAGAVTQVASIDVADAKAMADWLVAFDRDTPIDLVIANAGVSGGPAAGEFSEGVALATRQVTANLLGCINTIEPLLPAMTRRGAGHIAVVASVAGLRGLPYSPAYSASKAGARAYGEGLRALLRPAGVDVTVICPGFFHSPMTDRFKGATSFVVTTDQAMRIVRRGLDRRRSRISFHPLLVLGLKLADLAPARIGDAILRGVRFHIDPPE